MDSIKEEVAKNLLYQRKKNNLTQKELADKLGVKHNSISSWENGTNSIDIETLFKLCEIFDISVNDMYGIYTADQYLNLPEQDLIHKYRFIDEKGKHTVDTVLEMEYNKCNNIQLLPNSAHAIEGTSEEDIRHDEDIMDDF